MRVDGRREIAKTPYKGTYQAHDTLGKYLPCISQQRISMLATDKVLLNAQDTPQENWAKDTNRQSSQEIQTAVKHTTHHCVSFLIRRMQIRRIMRAISISQIGQNKRSMMMAWFVVFGQRGYPCIVSENISSQLCYVAVRCKIQSFKAMPIA